MNGSVQGSRTRTSSQHMHATMWQGSISDSLAAFFRSFFLLQQANSFRRMQLKSFYFICKFLHWTISAFKPQPSTWTHQPPFSKIFPHDSTSYDLFDAALIREDVAETLTPWYAVTHSSSRVPAATIKKIKEAIPARWIFPFLLQCQKKFIGGVIFL